MIKKTDNTINAEDMINGICCSLCGRYFSHPEYQDVDAVYVHGYPVACWECYDEGCGYQEAIVETLK